MALTTPAHAITWQELTARPRPSGAVRIPYGSDPLQHGDLWLPQGKGPHPVVLMVHGGCWQTKVAKADLMDWAAADLRQRGYAVWNIEYRGVDTGGGYPGTFRDVAAAADKLRELAPRYRLNLTPLVAIGHSAGGHLALWLAARPGLPADSPLRTRNPLPIAHVVSLGGLPDLAAAKTEAAHACGTDTIDRLVAGGTLADTSLPPLLPRGTTMTLVNGALDTVAPPATAARFAAAMRRAGLKAGTVVVPGQGHPDEVAPGQPAWDAAVNAITHH